MKLRNSLLTLLALCAYAALFFASGPSKPKQVTFDAAPGTTGNAGSLTRITSDPVPEFFPNVSPDGKRMVFHIRDDRKLANERWSIMMVNLGQPGRIPLVGAWTSRPSFFPDSKTIVYGYLKPTKPVIAKGSVDGTAGISYVAATSMGDYDGSPMISPNGKKVAFTTTMGSSSQICTMDLSGMNQTILTEGYNPTWSPDASKLAYSKFVGKYEQIFVYDFATGQSTQLTSGDFNNSDPKYSANGRYLVFSSNRDNQNEHIFVMRSDGSEVVQLTQGNTRNGMPAFGPDNTIYFASNAGTKGSRTAWDNSDIWSLKPILQ